LPNDPIRTDAVNWNAVWAALPINPIKTFGDPAAPSNPITPIVTSMVADGGYMKIRAQQRPCHRAEHQADLPQHSRLTAAIDRSAPSMRSSALDRCSSAPSTRLTA
jgi:hypothetical protein